MQESPKSMLVETNARSLGMGCLQELIGDDPGTGEKAGNGCRTLLYTVETLMLMLKVEICTLFVW